MTTPEGPRGPKPLLEASGEETTHSSQEVRVVAIGTRLLKDQVGDEGGDLGAQRVQQPERTARAYRSGRLVCGCVRVMIKVDDRLGLDSITVEEARAWALRHPGQLPSLRAMFNDARRSGIVMSNPFRELGIERPRGRRDLPSEWLTAKDIERLAQCAREVHEANGYGDTLAGLLVFAAYTGLRPGELYALRYADLGAETLEVKRAADSRTRAITLPKNGRPRTVVYPAKAREAVEAVPRWPASILSSRP